jgi:hypothetical protein
MAMEMLIPNIIFCGFEILAGVAISVLARGRFSKMSDSQNCERASLKLFKDSSINLTRGEARKSKMRALSKMKKQAKTRGRVQTRRPGLTRVWKLTRISSPWRRKRPTSQMRSPKKADRPVVSTSKAARIWLFKGCGEESTPVEE